MSCCCLHVGGALNLQLLGGAALLLPCVPHTVLLVLRRLMATWPLESASRQVVYLHVRETWTPLALASPSVLAPLPCHACAHIVLADV